VQLESPDDLCLPYYVKDPYRLQVKGARANFLAPSDREVTGEQWKRAVIHAYSTASTVEEMLADLPTWKSAAEKDGGEIGGILANFERPGGDVHAFSSLLRFANQRRGIQTA
jgi:hypothetical protein